MNILAVVILVFLLLLGIGYLFKPEEMFEGFKGKRFKGKARLTDDYIENLRFMGVLCIIGSIVGMYFVIRYM